MRSDSQEVSKEAFVESKESLCSYNLDEAVERILVQGLALLIIGPSQNGVEDVLFLLAPVYHNCFQAGHTMTQHTPTPEAADAARCFLGPSEMRSFRSMKRFDALYIGNCTLEPAPVRRIAASAPFIRPR